VGCSAKEQLPSSKSLWGKNFIFETVEDGLGCGGSGESPRDGR
jgi:hypothetical protein